MRAGACPRVARLEGTFNIAIGSHRAMTHTDGELPSADWGGDGHATGCVADSASADQRHLSRVCARGGRSLFEGVLWQTETATTRAALMAIMEGSAGVEVAEASSVSSFSDMEDGS